MQHQYVRAALYAAVSDGARAELAELAERMASDLGAVSLRSLTSDAAELARVQEVLSARGPTGVSAMVLDRNWRLVASSHPAGTAALNIPVGQQVPWELSEERPEAPAAPLQGTLELPAGEHIAAASTLEGEPGYVVVYRSEADLNATSAELARSLPSLSGVTFLWTCALLGIIVFLVLGRFHDEVERERKQVAAETLRRSHSLVRTRDAVILGLAKLADSRDPETGDHLERMSIYSTMLASALQRHPDYSEQVTPAFVRLIGISTALHDIGKVGIEDAILRKPGPLTPEQTARIQEHAAIGGECLLEIELRLGTSNFLQMAREIAFAHHERWDGGGYPKGLAGDHIPLSARIAAIADVYDALSSKRVYKSALPHDVCVATIRSEAGKAFDPKLVEVWLTIEHKYRDIAVQYASDSTAEMATSAMAEVEEPHIGIRKDTLVAVAAVAQR